MKKIALLISISLIGLFQTLAQNPTDTVNTKVVFPDSLFRSQLYKLIDVDNNKQILWSEVWNVHKIKISNTPIKSLKGIEAFVNLDTLSLRSLSLQTLDLTANNKMVYLEVYWQRTLTSVAVSKKAPYTYIACNDNGLTSFDASGLKSLKTLKVGAQKLTSLNIQGTSLDYLNSFENPKISVCVDSEVQWNSIPQNDLKTCYLNNPNADICQYELTCLLITDLEESKNLQTKNQNFIDYDLLGSILPSIHNQKIIIRRYDNGNYEKLYLVGE